MGFTSKTVYHPRHRSFVTTLLVDGCEVGHCQWALIFERNIIDMMIESIFITENQRRKGYGSALLRTMSIYAVGRRARFVYLNETLDEGKENLFFQRFGFKYVSDDNEMRVSAADFSPLKSNTVE